MQNNVPRNLNEGVGEEEYLHSEDSGAENNDAVDETLLVARTIAEPPVEGALSRVSMERLIPAAQELHQNLNHDSEPEKAVKASLEQEADRKREIDRLEAVNAENLRKAIEASKEFAKQNPIKPVDPCSMREQRATILESLFLHAQTEKKRAEEEKCKAQEDEDLKEILRQSEEDEQRRKIEQQERLAKEEDELQEVLRKSEKDEECRKIEQQERLAKQEEDELQEAIRKSKEDEARKRKGMEKAKEEDQDLQEILNQISKLEEENPESQEVINGSIELSSTNCRAFTLAANHHAVAVGGSRNDNSDHDGTPSTYGATTTTNNGGTAHSSSSSSTYRM